MPKEIRLKLKNRPAAYVRAHLIFTLLGFSGVVEFCRWAGMSLTTIENAFYGRAGFKRPIRRSTFVALCEVLASRFNEYSARIKPFERKYLYDSLVDWANETKSSNLWPFEKYSKKKSHLKVTQKNYDEAISALDTFIGRINRSMNRSTERPIEAALEKTPSRKELEEKHAD